MLFEEISNTIERLRSLEDNAKRRIVIWGSGIVMGGVLLLWIGYFSLSFQTVASETQETQTFWGEIRETVVVFGKTTARGTRIVIDQIGTILGTERTISIEDNRQF